jgi:protocatechuate 3,4-dioxygenase beta subunit
MTETMTRTGGSDDGAIIERSDDVTEVVLHAMAQAPSGRLRTIMNSFVKHMHDFAREVNLTEPEYDLGIEFLNRIGQATNKRHNEGILFADAIGLSTLVCLLNNGNGGATETAAALLGPFWRMNSPKTANGGSIIRSPTPGRELFVSCLVRDGSGKPIEGVDVDVWQSSPVGLYENQDDHQADMNLRGKFTTDAEGRFGFRSVKPAGYPVPTDGPVGDMLRAQHRHPYRPAHVHFLAFKPGFKTLVTQVFVDDDQYLRSDVVFGVTRALVGDFRYHESGVPPVPEVRGPWYTLDYTFVMEAGEAKLPTPPIE